METRGTGLRSYVDLVKQSGVAWAEDRAPTMGAALAFMGDTVADRQLVDEVTRNAINELR
jgi:hypothetical protein